MATLIKPSDVVFLDTSYAIALSASTDQFHRRSLELAEELEEVNAQLVTTQAVLLEIGNALARQRYRAAAIQLLNALQSDENVEVHQLSEDLFSRAFELY